VLGGGAAAQSFFEIVRDIRSNEDTFAVHHALSRSSHEVLILEAVYVEDRRLV
jgi:hypothetical protein